MTNSQRQHGIGSLAPDEQIVGKPGGIVEAGVKQYGIFKKIKKGVKKVFKSPLGKAALLGAGAYFMPGIGAKAAGGWGPWASKIGGWGSKALLGRQTTTLPGQATQRAGGLWNWIKANKGKSALLGLGAAGMAAPFFGGKDDDDEDESPWHITPPSIANIRNMARARDSSLAFLPPEESVMSGYYGSKEGGIVGLANGGPANAQAEQMLKMEYQKYRNQGGTMSYQQFKMAVLQQAQGQGPMAQGQQQAPQMAAHGGRIKYQGGELVEDASMVEETPEGMMAENVEEVQGEPTREQLEVLAMEIFQLRLEELDEEQLMVVYQAAMEQQPREEMMQEEDIQFDPQMAADGGRIGFQQGGWNPGVGRDTQGYLSNHPSFEGGQGGNTITHTGGDGTNVLQTPVVPETSTVDRLKGWFGLGNKDEDETIYSTSGYDKRIDEKKDKLNQSGALDELRAQGLLNQGGRVGRAEGGIMDLGGMEKDYRQEGGFVPLGGEEKADDVPARLSKNEFVFTADAVRAAGGGDIDSGAEVMQNVMENLEEGGEISEESQGAQGMYNNMQQLQTRIE